MRTKADIDSVSDSAPIRFRDVQGARMRRGHSHCCKFKTSGCCQSPCGSAMTSPGNDRLRLQPRRISIRATSAYASCRARVDSAFPSDEMKDGWQSRALCFALWQVWDFIAVPKRARGANDRVDSLWVHGCTHQAFLKPLSSCVLSEILHHLCRCIF